MPARVASATVGYCRATWRASVSWAASVARVAASSGWSGSAAAAATSGLAVLRTLDDGLVATVLAADTAVVLSTNIVRCTATTPAATATTATTGMTICATRFADVGRNKPP